MDTDFWATKATAFLDALVLAARLGGCNPGRVNEWARGDASEAETILREHDHQAEADLVAELRTSSTPKTTASIRLVMCRMLANDASEAGA
jgi:hypothetical protein